MTWFLVKLGIRLVAFTAVFWFATRHPKGYIPAKPADPADPRSKPMPAMGKRPKLVIQPRWAIPVVGLLFALLNTALYWLVTPILNVATLRSLSLLMPFVVNGLLLWGTARIVQKKQWLRLDGWFAAVWLSLILTGAHGVLYFVLDYLPGL
jgi:uncharacterized membrane protein YvlD (DUF360 family)